MARSAEHHRPQRGSAWLVFYQPVIVNADITGGLARDNLGAWRNNGVSGQGNTTLAQGLLSVAEGNNSGALSSYGRVRFGFTSRSTAAWQRRRDLTGFDHAAGTDTDINGLSATGGFGLIRIASAQQPELVPGFDPGWQRRVRDNQILWGVVSDNPAATSTWDFHSYQDGVCGVAVGVTAAGSSSAGLIRSPAPA